MARLDPKTPVLIGVGDSSERIDAEDYRGLSAVELAAAAARRALADTGVGASRIAECIEVVAGVRQFEISIPGATAPLGRSNNYPRSVAGRLGIAPRRAVLDVVGGQSPQHLVNEFAGAIADGEEKAVLIVGSEAISTARHFSGREDRPDFSEEVEGDLEDRGTGAEGMVTSYELEHGLTEAPPAYALFENARRAKLNASRRDYARMIGELFEPFSKVAAHHPHASAPVVRSAEELVTPTERNRLIADPYTRYVVARDQVNQGAALVLVSLETADSLGVPDDRRVFLHGHADLRERNLLDRHDLSSAPASLMAAEHAHEMAGVTVDDFSTFDFYSCFPIAVLATAVDGLGLSPADPRGLTSVGGLPFFGGAGNNYSMHAIAEVVRSLREAPGTYGFVGANGGSLSKYSVGIYSTEPKAWVPDSSSALQHEIDSWKTPGIVRRPHGWAAIETYTVMHDRQGKRTGLVVGRTSDEDRRFLALTVDDDEQMLDLLSSDEPVGRKVFAQSTPYGNRVFAHEPPSH